jgi:DNA polymerase III epsilon subunit-like protein
MQSIVSIDIETTGLSEDRDAIIEIGAVKFKGHRVEDEWSSLITGRPFRIYWDSLASAMWKS